MNYESIVDSHADDIIESPLLREHLQFSGEAADRIESRARRSRKIFYYIAITLFAAIYALVVIGTWKYLDNQKYISGLSPMQITDAQLQARVAALVASEKMIPDKPDAAQEALAAASRAKISEALDEWDRVKKIESVDKKSYSTINPWIPVITHGLLIFGFIAIMGFIIQIALMFMRYYARLAEFFDTQVDALRLSRGHVDTAIRFMDHFSPNGIEVGRSPRTVHDAVLEGLARVASKEKLDS